MLTYEADQRHADLLTAACKLTASSKIKATPWDKAPFLARHPLAGPFLDEKRRVEFRSNCCAVCLSKAGVEESHVGLVTGGQGITGN